MWQRVPKVAIHPFKHERLGFCGFRAPTTLLGVRVNDILELSDIWTVLELGLNVNLMLNFPRLGGSETFDDNTIIMLVF